MAIYGFLLLHLELLNLLFNAILLLDQVSHHTHVSFLDWVHTFLLLQYVFVLINSILELFDALGTDIL